MLCVSGNVEAAIALAEESQHISALAHVRHVRIRPGARTLPRDILVLASF